MSLCGWNARRVIFGALNLCTGWRLLLSREHQRAGDFQAFLRELHRHCRGWYVALLLDEDRSHTAAGSVRLAEALGIQLLWLPKRCPELNPLERLWGEGKDNISVNKQYPDIDEQVNRFTTYLENLSSYDALHTAGVFSSDFWLRRTLSKKFCGLA